MYGVFPYDGERREDESKACSSGDEGVNKYRVME